MLTAYMCLSYTFCPSPTLVAQLYNDGSTEELYLVVLRWYLTKQIAIMKEIEPRDMLEYKYYISEVYTGLR